MNRFIRDSESKYLKEEAIKEYILEITNSLDEDDILVLVTRKGYWLYVVLLEDDLKEEIKNVRGVRIFSDRYFTKCIDFKELLPKNKKKKEIKIIIFDDTMNSGVNLFFFYAYFSKQVRRELRKLGIELIVKPYTYALNTRYNFSDDNPLMIREFQRLCRDENTSQLEQQIEARKMIKAFNEALDYKIRLVTENINKIRNKQVEWFEQGTSPLVMDLPIVSVERKSDSTFTLPAYTRIKGEEYARGITVTEQQFQNLIAETDDWRFIENNEELSEIPIHCDFFQFKNRKAFFNVQDILHDCIVRCDYIKNKDGSRTLVFVPFAIVKSMEFGDVLSYFFILLEEIEPRYKEKIYKYINENSNLNIKEKENEKNIDNSVLYDIIKKNHNLCRNMYRTIIFYLSYYIFLYFSEHVQEKVGIELGFDMEIMKENFSSDFIDMFKECVKNSEDNLKRFQKSFLRMPESRSVAPIDIEIFGSNQRKSVNEESLYNIIYNRLEKKGKNCPNRKLRERIYTIETMIAEIESSFLFESQKEEIEVITKKIIGGLKASKFTNAIYVDNKNQVIYRGFSYGENSELDTPLGSKYFYAYVYAFYYYVGVKNYKKYYADFADKVETLFYVENYMNILISEEIFYFFKNYFGNLPDNMIESMIMGRVGILSFNQDKGEKDDFKYFVNRAFNKVKKWSYIWE